MALLSIFHFLGSRSATLAAAQTSSDPPPRRIYSAALFAISPESGSVSRFFVDLVLFIHASFAGFLQPAPTAAAKSFCEATTGTTSEVGRRIWSAWA